MAQQNYNWASSKRRYEWRKGYEQGMAPRDQALEAELFSEDTHVHSGINFSKYDNIEVKIKGKNPPEPFERFEDANLHPVMKENIALARYATPTPVQRYSITIVTAGRDLMACAQTGSGKTAAFLVPTCSALFANAPQLVTRCQPHQTGHFKAKPLVLIMAPTRELCSQIFDEARRFCYRSMLRPCAVYGGAGITGQSRELDRGCDVLVAAPGRLLDFIGRGKIDLSNLRYLVLDEADRMLDMGFEPIIREIVMKSGMRKDRQTLLYSATFPKEIQLLARDFLARDYLFLRVGRVGGTTTDITQRILWVDEQNKREELRRILTTNPPCRTLIFVDTKRSADSLDQFLYSGNFPSTSIHGDRSQMEREDAILAFKSGSCPILVATAVVARGIDIKNVMHVINYDMTNQIDEYIHRIGRTARVGNSGLATSFFNSRNMPVARDLTKVLQECHQEIPEFLQPYVSDKLVFRDDQLDDIQPEDQPTTQHGGYGGPPPPPHGTFGGPRPSNFQGATAQSKWAAPSADQGSNWNPGAVPW